MLRKLLTLLVIFSTSLCFAQEHLKFMGIPLDGTIDQFQTKLAAKGITVDEKDNKNSNFCRHFKGTFFGYNAKITIYYDEFSKLVYLSTVIFNSSDIIPEIDYSSEEFKNYSKEQLRDYINNYENKWSNYFWTRLKNFLFLKYSNADIQKCSYKGFGESFIYLIPTNSDYKYLGKIELLPGCLEHGCTIEYLDVYNALKVCNKKLLDDL